MGMPGRSTIVRRRHVLEEDRLEGGSITVSVHVAPVFLLELLTFLLSGFLAWV
jgi:hypothetical protein